MNSQVLKFFNKNRSNFISILMALVLFCCLVGPLWSYHSAQTKEFGEEVFTLTGRPVYYSFGNIKEYHSYNARKEYYYYDIWKIQAQDLFSPHPKIILFIEPFTKVIITYNNADSFENDLNYLLESMVED